MSADTDDARRDETRNRSLLGPIILTFAVLIAIGAVVLAVLGIIDWTQDEEDEEIDVGVTLNDVAADPEAYAGTSVTVNGEVSDVVSPQAVVIGGQEFFGGAAVLVVDDEEILLPEGVEREAPVVEENDLVQVTGTVRVLTAEDEEAYPEEFGFLFEDEAYSEFEGEPVILAQVIDLAPRLTPVDEEEGSTSPASARTESRAESSLAGDRRSNQ